MSRDKLKRWLDETGVSQKRLAQEIGVTPMTVTNWVKGANSTSPETAKKIEAAVKRIAELAQKDVPASGWRKGK